MELRRFGRERLARFARLPNHDSATQLKARLNRFGDVFCEGLRFVSFKSTLGLHKGHGDEFLFRR